MIKNSIQEIIDFYYTQYFYEFLNMEQLIEFCIQLRKDKTRFKHLRIGKKLYQKQLGE